MAPPIACAIEHINVYYRKNIYFLDVEGKAFSIESREADGEVVI
jgi:hypothetical protein